MKHYLMTFLKGALAGMAIGLGGFCFIGITFLLPGELGKVLGSIAFAIGLFLVCTFFLMLYTGKIGGVYEKKQQSTYYIDLPLMLLGNAIGAFGLGFLCNLLFQNLDIMNRVHEVAASRMNFAKFEDFLGCFVKGFLCGTCVYLAVKCFAKDRLRLLGTSLLVFFVFLFVYCGFEHCIANMFYFGFDNRVGGNTFINLAIVIVANSIGPIPAVFMAKLLERK